MRKILLAILISQFIFSCTQKNATGSPDLTVSGKVNNLNPGSKVYLEELTGNSFKRIDTTQIDGDNNYSFSLRISEPSFYRINFLDKQFVNLILNETDVTVNADGDEPMGFAEIKGSIDTDYFTEINGMSEEFQMKVQALNVQFANASRQGDTQTAMNLSSKYSFLEQEFDKKLKTRIWEMGTSITAILSISFLNNQDDIYTFLDSLAQRFNNELPASKFTKQLVSQVDQMSKLAIGAIAPEIELPDPEGNPITLSSLRGKHVLIDFWAGWCKPCRVENPNVLRMYNVYHDKGFEIFGVSLDRTRQQWISAIQQDGLIWKHGSDLTYFQSQAAQEYQIAAIPATYLVDPDGRIIAKNLRGPSLESKLGEIFD
ncbi:MAG: TlpA disulfide reductase family protein [Bacteroidetes bacterium]|nr:TlpA disulfide reductase family protein [Bacteroidota bacterium]MDA1120240.1 TlpA disulfide reductase family protein [Bacteroidota bacterium]